MSTIQIPVDIHLLTLYKTTYKIVTRNISNGVNSVPQRRREEVVTDYPYKVSETTIQAAIQRANIIWGPADISFSIRRCVQSRTATVSATGTVDREDTVFLTRKYPGRNGISMMVVGSFYDKVLGGSAIVANRACIVGRRPNPGLGNVVAHEFGHLLALEHVPKDEKSEKIEDSYNLMFRRVNSDTRLTPDQIENARTSALAMAHNKTPAPIP